MGSHLSDEEGTTLSELMIVILLLGVVGAITTVGIVQGFDAQLASSNVAETLDGTRIATQRVRDFARGATEVCSYSTATELVLWTDDDNDGSVVPAELDIFELVADASGEDVFQRRVPLPGTAEIQLIRDDIINNALFTYDVPPADQPGDLTCQDATGTTGGASRTRSVGVTFTVDNPSPGKPDLTTATTVQIRNAGLQTISGTAPTADFTVTCPVGTQQCSFDASASTDDDGLVTSWEWDFGDGTTGTGETVTHTYAVGDVDYDVELTVTDDEGLTDSLLKTARPGLVAGNATPVANFTFSCVGLQCTYDGSSSSDSDGTIASYAWDYGDGNTASGPTPATHTYSLPGNYPVSLTVTDDGGKSHTKTITVTASNTTMRVASLVGTGTALTGGGSGTWTATVRVQLTLTTAGNPGAGVNISALGTGGNGGNAISRSGSCSTDVNGRCDIVLSGLAKQVDPLTLTITQVNDPNNNYVYDADQNLASCIRVKPASSSSEPTDGNCGA